jgi:hypothetical protein
MTNLITDYHELSGLHSSLSSAMETFHDTLGIVKTKAPHGEMPCFAQ